MSTIVTRAGKGAPLTNTELDSNFTNLNTDKLEINAALGTPASVTLTNATGLPTAGLVDNAVTDAKLRDSAGLSVIGRGANSTGDPADIVAGTNHQVLRRDGSSLGFGAVDLSSNQAVTGTLPVNQGGTGITSFGSGVATWLGTPSSANLAAAVTDETGTGALVFANSPTLVTPALGTPASGVVTNLTGTASININGTVGATTPAAGAFTTLNTSGAVVFNEAGANVDFRVESDTITHALFVQGSNGNVGIGTSGPAVSGLTISRDTGSATPTPVELQLRSTTNASDFDTDAAIHRISFRTEDGSLGGGISSAIVSRSANAAYNLGQLDFFASQTNSPFLTRVFGTEGNNEKYLAVYGSNGIGFPSIATSIRASSGDLLFLTNSTERLRITSAGDVGIGTSSPGAKLDVAAGNIVAGVKGVKITGITSFIAGGSFGTSLDIAHNYFSNQGSFRAINVDLTDSGTGNQPLYGLYVTAENNYFSGNVGIGTTTPDANLTVNGAASFAAGTALLPSIARASDLNTGIFFPAADTIAFSEGGAERMRIDASGNVLVGKTTSNAATVGFEARPDGRIGATYDGGNPAYFNRLTSNGELIRLLKDSTVVGSIGIETDGFYVDGEIGHTGLQFGAVAVIPRDNGVNTDGLNDLGAAALRFRDLYLSGGLRGDTLTFGNLAGTERLRITSAGNVGIGTASPNASAILDAQSTTKGVRMPNMTTTQKNAIASPAAGLMVYDTTLAKLCVYTTAWETITSL
jgi:hypothetical protein